MQHFGRRLEESWHGYAIAAGLAIGLLVTTLYFSAILAVALHAFGWVAPGRVAWSGGLVAAVGMAQVALAAWMIERQAAAARGCGREIAARLGAQRLIAPDHPARAAAEEIAATAGMPAPEIWRLDEDAINAFALGANPTDSVVVLTRGAMERLRDEEVRALIAFGIARIADGDARRDAQLTCVLAPLLAPAVASRIARAARATAPRWARGLWTIAYGTARIFGVPGYATARLIKLALARLRPDCTDVHSVLLTGDADALDTVLERITENEEDSPANLRSPRAIEIDHALFGPQLDVTFGITLRTHLDAFSRRQRLGLVRGQVQRQRSFAEARLTPIAVHAEGAFEQLFDYDFDRALRAERVLTQLSSTLRNALRDPLGCHAIVCGSLTTGRAARIANQRARFVREGHPDAVLEARNLQDDIVALDRAAWLALADMAVPTLRMMRQEQRDAFRADLERLATGHADALEFFVVQLWLANLERTTPRARSPFSPGSRLGQDTCSDANAVVLAFAHLGNPDDGVARRAFGDGVRFVGVPAGARVFSRPDDTLPQRLGRAVQSFTAADVPAQRALIRAAVLATAGDAPLEPFELETLRAFAKVLGCIAPMILEPSLDTQESSTASDAAPRHEDPARPETPTARSGGVALAALWTDELDALIALTAGGAAL